MSKGRKDFEKIQKAIIDELLNEKAATTKVTKTKTSYTEETKKQRKALLEFAHAQLVVHQNQGDAERQAQIAIKTKKLEALAQKDLNKQLRELDRQAIINDKNREIKADQKAAQARKVNSQIIKEQTATRKKELAELKRSIIARSEQGKVLTGVHGRMARLLGMQKKLNLTNALAVRNQRNLNSSLSKFRSKLLIASFGIGLVQKTVNGLIGEYGKYQAAQSRVNATLKSTGFASGQTIKSLSSLASEIQKNTGVSDTLTLSSSGLLATFTQIGGETFPTAQQAIVDMTAAMNAGQVTQEGLKSSTVQVGKALNDPIKGLTSLSRVGVLFTKQQKDQIKAFVNTNQVSKAQAIILKELNKEFGGVASADGYEKSLRLLESAFGDLQKEIGIALLPVFEVLVGKLGELVAWTSENRRAIAEYTVSIGIAAGALKAYQKWLLLTTIASKEGITAIIKLRRSMMALAMSGGPIGLAVIALGFLGKKLLEGSGLFKGLDRSVEGATDSLLEFSDISDAIGKQKSASQELDRINTLLGELPGTIETLTTFEEKWEKYFIAVGRSRKEMSRLVPQTITLSDGYSFIAKTAEDASFEILKYRLQLEKQGLTQAEIVKKTKEAIDNFTKIKEQNASEDIKKTTQKYKDQLIVLEEKSDLDKELAKVGLDLNIGADTLSEALKNQKGQYLELANAVADVVNKKKEQAQQEEIINNFMKIGSESITFMSELSNKAMQEDIENMKKSSTFKLAQKRGDDKKMAALEKEAAAKTLKQRQNLFLAEKAMAIAQVIIDYTRAEAKGFAGAGPIFGIPMAALMKAQMAASIALITAQAAAGMPKFAKGGDFVTTGPQMIMVGDNPGGRERVQVTPLSSPNEEGPQPTNNIIVNVSGNVLTQDFVEEELAESIREAARRGTDFGIS